MNVIAADPIDFVNLNWTAVAIVDPIDLDSVAIDLDSVAVVVGILFACLIKIQKHSYLGSSIFWLKCLFHLRDDGCC